MRTLRICYFDLETGDADRLYTAGPGFVRIAAFAVNDGPVQVRTDIDTFTRQLEDADFVVGHNILAFDLPALERYHGLNLARLVQEDRVIDTLIVARQNDPPLSGGQDAKRYSLSAVSRRFLGADKVQSDDGESVLKRLAREYGGFDQIPVEHPEYVHYAKQDVELVRGLAHHLVVDEYVQREHQVMWRLHHISKHGFRVDVELANRLIAEQAARIERVQLALHERYGLPLEGKKPHATTAGKAALEQAFVDLGVEPPRTAKGSLATSKTALLELESGHADNAGLVELCQTIRALNGERSIAQTILSHTGPDGRIRPSVNASQATGRISVTNPGLTVMGKRDRANVLERALLLPDPGHVLICADLSQVDARAMAMHAQDPAYIAALAPGKDMHDEMAAALFGEDGWDRAAGHHPRRGDAKAITHATTYGMGPAALAASTGMSVDAARQQLARLDVSFSKLAAYKNYIRQKAVGQVLQNGFGRWMRVQPGQEYTQAPALVGQGTARDLMMEGLLRLPAWLLPGLRAIIHDEIVLSVPEERADEAERAILAALQFEVALNPGDIPVPVLAEVSARGRDWADAYRNEKKSWPEVARAHRERVTCDDTACTWHTRAEQVTVAVNA